MDTESMFTIFSACFRALQTAGVLVAAGVYLGRR